MPLSNRRWNASRNELLLSIGLVATTAAVVAVLHIPGLTHGPTLDGAVFTEVADRLLHGGAPYVGAWDHKPPGIYWTLAAVRALIPGIDPWHVTWVVSVLATTGLALVAALLSEDLPQRAAIALVTAIYASAYPIALGGGQTETPAALLVIAALVLTLRPGLSARRVFVAGILSCGSLLYSFEVLPIVLVVAALAISNAPGWVNRARSMVAGIAGAMSVAGPAALLVVSSGAAGPAWSQLVTYNIAYSALNRSQPFDWETTSRMYFVLLPLLAAAVLGARNMLAATPRLAQWLVAPVLLGGVYIAWQARVEPHYLIPLLPLLAALAARCLGSFRQVGPTRIRLGVSAGLAVMAIVGVWMTIGWSRQLEVEFTNASAQGSVASWLRENSRPGDTAFVWGNQPAVYYESGVEPTSPFVYVFPLLTPGYVTAGDVAQVVSAVGAPKARWVIDAGSAAPGLPGLVPLLVPRAVAVGDGRVANVVGPLREAVAAEYQEAAVVGGWIIYERRP